MNKQNNVFNFKIALVESLSVAFGVDSGVLSHISLCVGNPVFAKY